MPAEFPQTGGIIRSARENLGLTQAELGKKSRIPKETISLVENNRRILYSDAFCRLVHALDISADRFAYPRRARCSLEDEQFINGYLALPKQNQWFLRIVLRALQHDGPEKQG